MNRPHHQIYDAVIAGAGPVGLFLACELGLAGVRVLVLEQAPSPDAPMKQLPFGLRGLTAPTIEALDRRGLLEDVQAAARVAQEEAGGAAGAHWLRQTRRPGGYFAGIQFFLDRVDASCWPYRLADAAGVGIAVDMASLEAVLAARAEALGVTIVRGCAVEGLEQSDEEVVVQASGTTVRAHWLVGCDGARSAVRKAGGFGFAGTEPEFTGYSALTELTDPARLRPGRHRGPGGVYVFTPPGTIATAEYDGGACHRAELTRDHVEAVLRRVSGEGVAVTALHLGSTWTDRAFQADAYRLGRVLLAGDAAHIHSPLGGQGLNLGLGDAMNLGWKLAATIRGDAPAGLIDSYASERMPEGARILDWSRAQVALMRPEPASDALSAVVRDLMETRDGATYFAERSWGVTLRTGTGGAHPLVGRSVPDFALADGARVADLLRAGKGLLLDFDASPARKAAWERWPSYIDHVAGETPDRLGLSAMLVRPDGVVAWASDDAADAEGLAETAARWFGAPREGGG